MEPNNTIPTQEIDDTHADAFNAWMEDFIEHPDKFRAVEEEVANAIAEASAGEIPSYGARCAATLRYYISQVTEGE